MNLKHLEVFVSVYQLQSMTKAARQLHMVQPSVSAIIKDIEMKYEVCLFERMSRHIYPTQYADQLYQYAIHILSLFNELESHLLHAKTTEKIKIGTSITIGNFFLPTLIQQLKIKHPHLEVKTIIHNTSAIEQALLDNQIDIGLIEGTIVRKDVIMSETFYEDELLLITNSQHPLSKRKNVTLEQIHQYPLLLREKGSGVRELVESVFWSHHISLNPICESVSTQAIVRGVINGMGVSILPYLLVEEELKKHQLMSIPIKDIRLNREYSIVYHKNKYFSDVLSDFKRIVKGNS